MVPIVEEKLFTAFDVFVSPHRDSVLAPNANDFRGAVLRRNVVIDELALVALAQRVHHGVLVEVEQEADELLVVNHPSSLRLVLGDNRASVLVHKLTACNVLHRKNSPAVDIRKTQPHPFVATKGGGE